MAGKGVDEGDRLVSRTPIVWTGLMLLAAEKHEVALERRGM